MKQHDRRRAFSLILAGNRLIVQPKANLGAKVSLAEVECLVAELLATGQLNADTRDDMYRILAEARSSRSYADDLRYLRDLHTRIIPAGARSQSGSHGTSNTGSKPQDLQALVRKLRDELAKANQTIVELQGRTTTTEPPGSNQFKEIKKRFARRYHPNAVGSSGIEAMVRAEIFKEFWTEFEEVERSQ